MLYSYAVPPGVGVERGKMGLRVVGAGVGRTGTIVELVLQQLVGGRCHHMMEVMQHQEAESRVD